MSEQQHPRDVIAAWFDAIGGYDQSYRAADRVVMALYKAGYEVTKITDNQALLAEMETIEAVLARERRDVETVRTWFKRDLKGLRAENERLKEALAGSPLSPPSPEFIARWAAATTEETT